MSMLSTSSVGTSVGFLALAGLMALASLLALLSLLAYRYRYRYRCRCRLRLSVSSSISISLSLSLSHSYRMDKPGDGGVGDRGACSALQCRLGRLVLLYLCGTASLTAVVTFCLRCRLGCLAFLYWCGMGQAWCCWRRLLCFALIGPGVSRYCCTDAGWAIAAVV